LIAIQARHHHSFLDHVSFVHCTLDQLAGHLERDVDLRQLDVARDANAIVRLGPKAAKRERRADSHHGQGNKDDHSLRHKTSAYGRNLRKAPVACPRSIRACA